MKLSPDKSKIPIISGILRSQPQLGEELEFRIGSIDSSRGGNKFVSGVRHGEFLRVLNELSRVTAAEETKSIVTYYSDNTRVITSDNKPDVFQMKQRLQNVDLQFSNVAVRFASAVEIPTDRATGDVVYTRNRHKYVFARDGYDIELQIIQPATGPAVYEIEIEFRVRPTSLEVLFGALKVVLHAMYPQLHSIFSIIEYQELTRMYNSVVDPSRRNTVLAPRSSRPRNITRQDAPAITHYSVTNKLNGVGYQLFLSPIGVYLIGGNSVDKISQRVYSESLNTIFDGEWFNGGYYIFDTILYKGTNVSQKNHQTRLSYCDIVLQECDFKSETWSICKKQFYNSGNLEKDTRDCMRYIYDRYKGTSISDNDGIIYTPNEEPHVNTSTLKYKFASTMTIDLLVDDGRDTLGGRSYRVNVYDELNKIVPFKPVKSTHGKSTDGASVDIRMFVRSDSSLYNELTDNLIVECTFDRKMQHFVPERVRWDKVKPNFSRVAAGIFYDIYHPLRLDNLLYMFRKSAIDKMIAANLKAGSQIRAIPLISQVKSDGSTIICANSPIHPSNGSVVDNPRVREIPLISYIHPSRVSVVDHHRTGPVSAAPHIHPSRLSIVDPVVSTLNHSPQIAQVLPPHRDVPLISHVHPSRVAIVDHPTRVSSRSPRASRSPTATAAVDTRVQVVPARVKADVVDSRGCLFKMRKYHNLQKKTLIDRYTHGKSVLDLGFGRGGDLLKYTQAGATQIWAVEPDNINLDEARIRLANKSNNYLEDVVFINTTAQESLTIKDAMNDELADVVASFFSLTFFFENENEFNRLLNTISRNIKIGGYLIGATVDGSAIREFLGSRDRVDIPGCYTIERRYNLSDPPGFGQSIFINLDPTSIVTGQLEYLSYWDMFVAGLRRVGLDLVESQMFDSPQNLGKEGLDYSKLHRSFVFVRSKTESEISSEARSAANKNISRQQASNRVNSIGVDVSFEIRLDYVEEMLVRTGTVGDGSCFFHSVLKAIDPAYRKADEAGKTTINNNLRALLSEKITIDEWDALGGGTTSLIEFSKRFYKYFLVDYTAKFPAIANVLAELQNTAYASTSEFKSDVKSKFSGREGVVVASVLDTIYNNTFRQFKKNIANCSVFVGEGGDTGEKSVDIFEYLSDYYNIDIYIVKDNTRRVTRGVNCNIRYKHRQSVIVLSVREGHFEIIGQRVVRGSKTLIARTFSPDDPLIVAMYNDSCN